MGQDIRGEGEVVKELNWTDLKKLTLEEIKAGPCLKVAGDGWDESAFYVVVNPQGIMRDRVEGICAQIDASRTFEEPKKKKGFLSVMRR